MFNATFHHHLLMKECLPGKPHTMTTRKLWGQYIHSIRDHLPMNFRVVAPSSIMAENEERQFSTLKRITKTSANYSKPGHIITNVLVRTHFQEKMTTSSNTHQQNKISKAAETVRMDRTTIPVDLLKKYPRDAQTHCERIADFLLPGHGVHWHKEEGQVVFHDSANDQPNPQSGPKLHHFRSTSLKDEYRYIRETWKKCLQQQVTLPASKLWVYEGQRLVRKVTTPFLDADDSSSATYDYLPHNMDDESETDQITEDAEDQSDSENEEEEDILQVDRMDPEPDLEQDVTTSESRPRESGGKPDKSSSCTRPETPGRTPLREVSTPSSRNIMNAVNSTSMSTPSRTSSCLQGSVTMTPPNTPMVPTEDRNFDFISNSLAKMEGPEWSTKLGSALSVVLGNVDIVQQMDRVKLGTTQARTHKQVLQRQVQGSNCTYDMCIE
ncbi:uncharacterized protein LOC144927213 [Branchiostoma floridae x Branchiostoma belcheri]